MCIRDRDSISTLLAQEAVANDTLLRAEITPFYGGNEFYLEDLDLLAALYEFGRLNKEELKIT